MNVSDIVSIGIYLLVAYVMLLMMWQTASSLWLGLQLQELSKTYMIPDTWRICADNAPMEKVSYKQSCGPFSCNKINNIDDGFDEPSLSTSTPRIRCALKNFDYPSEPDYVFYINLTKRR